jgi:8-oxo-dGTP pyrophosphatase MutT (NUDIX family)
MVEGSSEAPLVERNAIRVALLDTCNRLLLLHVRDMGNPAFGLLWELPGGGIKAGEAYGEAVVRELREETGIHVDTDRVGCPTWRRDVSYLYRGRRHLQHEIIVKVRLERAEQEIEGSQRVGFEAEDIFGFRWWTVDDIINSSERFYPRHLPKLLPRFLAGEQIEEPLELWP